MGCSESRSFPVSSKSSKGTLLAVPGGRAEPANSYFQALTSDKFYRGLESEICLNANQNQEREEDRQETTETEPADSEKAGTVVLVDEVRTEEVNAVAEADEPIAKDATSAEPAEEPEPPIKAKEVEEARSAGKPNLAEDPMVEEATPAEDPRAKDGNSVEEMKEEDGTSPESPVNELAREVSTPSLSHLPLD